MFSGLKLYCPATTIFPLESVLTELAMSLPEFAPILLTHNGVPVESYLTTKPSLFPLLANVVNAVVPSAANIIVPSAVYCPATTTFPLESTLTELTWSEEIPPILLAHKGIPSELYLTTKPSPPPLVAKGFTTGGTNGAGATTLGGMKLNDEALIIAATLATFTNATELLEGGRKPCGLVTAAPALANALTIVV